MADDWHSAADIEWEAFYGAVEGRALRPLFVDALAFLPAVELESKACVAVDLGCGDGKETLELLHRGWTVLAVDGAPEGIARLEASVPPSDRSRLTTRVARFADLTLPPVDLVYAGLSLPFCDPADFGVVWTAITAAIRPGGLFVGHLFGPHDTWAGKPGMTFHSRADVEALLTPFETLRNDEQDEDGEAIGGPKHWHVFHVIARRRA